MERREYIEKSKKNEGKEGKLREGTVRLDLEMRTKIMKGKGI